MNFIFVNLIVLWPITQFWRISSLWTFLFQMKYLNLDGPPLDERHCSTSNISILMNFITVNLFVPYPISQLDGPHLGEPHWFLSSISLAVKVRNYHSNMKFQLWHFGCRNTGRMKLHTAHPNGADLAVLGSYISLHSPTTSLPHLQPRICIWKAGSWELQGNVNFGTNTRISDAICFQRRALLYL